MLAGRDTASELYRLRIRQGLPLAEKEALTARRIRGWYEHHGGEVYVSFSGGKDSTVLLHQVRRIYPEVPAVFVDTGLEYPEIKSFVRSVENVVWMRPKMPFREVVQRYGYPVVSKKVARFVEDLRSTSGNNEATKSLRLTGRNQKGEPCPSLKLSTKWLRLIHAPFPVSDKCCDVMKKEPFLRYVKESGRVPMTGVMAGESQTRTRTYLRLGCNSFDGAKPISMPMAFWMEDDVWAYLRKHDVPYSRIYDMGERRTGCMFCMFGVHMEGEPNRFQRMARTHPKIHAYCMGKLGIAECLDYLGIPHGEPRQGVLSLAEETQ